VVCVRFGGGREREGLSGCDGQKRETRGKEGKTECDSDSDSDADFTLDLDPDPDTQTNPPTPPKHQLSGRRSGRGSPSRVGEGPDS
jgi:hypothetical protein